MNNKIILSISQLNFYIKSMFDSDKKLNDLLIEGEISNFIDHYKSGHLYFSLKDDKSIVKAVMFSSSARRLRFKPYDGMKVIVRARASIYEASGQYQLYVEDMQPDGIGALSLAYEQLKEKLKEEGLFDIANKKPIPKYPKRIGIVTSDTGAAVRDIENILARRYPIAEIILCPTLVQGEGAPEQIINAIEKFNELNICDVLIVGRGGGSIEDLWAFNDERVARAIFASKIPVISAVGHETDFTIADFVSDLRAPTPSAAAELATPDVNDLYSVIESYIFYMNKNMNSKIEKLKTNIFSLNESLKDKSPQKIVEEKRLKLDLLEYKRIKIFENIIYSKKEKFSKLNSKLNILSPLKVLSMGYAIATINNKMIKSVDDVSESDDIKLQLSDGHLECIVNKKNKKGYDEF